MLFFYATGLGVALAVARLLLGGPAGGIAAPGRPLRWLPVAAVALVLQVWLTWGAGGPLAGPGRVAALWLTHGVLAVVLVANLRRPGMAWLLAGMGLNFLVMAANGGLMPVSPETLVRGGREHVLAQPSASGDNGVIQRKKNVVLREEETRFALLSDRLVVPGHPGAFSAGDVLIAVGIVHALWATGAGAGQRAGHDADHPDRGRVRGQPVVT